MIRKDMLRSRTTIAELDEAFAAGSLQETWERLKQQVREGDELWRFSGSLAPKAVEQTGIDLAFRAGVALVRNGRIINYVVTVIT